MDSVGSNIAHGAVAGQGPFVGRNGLFKLAAVTQHARQVAQSDSGTAPVSYLLADGQSLLERLPRLGHAP